MMSERRKHRVRDLIDAQALVIGDGYRAKNSEMASDGLPFIRVADIVDGEIRTTGSDLLNQDSVAKAGHKVSQQGDALFTSKGTVGRFARVREETPRFVYSPQICFWRAVDTDLIDPDYIFHWMRSPEFRQQCRAVQGQTDMADYVSLRDQRSMWLTLPPLPEQRRIAAVLGALDDKIELNRQMNKTLEEMAQAIFKSWFIDFDGHTDLVESELGPIPRGWEVSSLPEAVDFREGPGILAKDFHDVGVPLIRLAGLKSGVSLLAGCNFLDPDKVRRKWDHFRLALGDILLSTSASLGRVAETDDEAVGAIPYTGIIRFRPQKGRSVRRYLRHFLTSLTFQRQVEAMGVGSVLRHFGPTHLKSMWMLLPPIADQRRFADVVKPMDRMRHHLVEQVATLRMLRDTLLPKLISGEVRVPEVDAVVEEGRQWS